MATTVRYAINKTKYLLPPEVQQLENTLAKFTDRDVRNTLILELALKTGARATELLNIKKSDLNSFERTIFIRGLKGSSDREIPLSAALYTKLLNFASQVSDENLFDVGYNRLRDIWVVYRPAPKKFHCLRHTFAIQLYKKTKDLRLVQLALGHRNITNTMVYADYIYSQNELRKLIL